MRRIDHHMGGDGVVRPQVDPGITSAAGEDRLDHARPGELAENKDGRQEGERGRIKDRPIFKDWVQSINKGVVVSWFKGNIGGRKKEAKWSYLTLKYNDSSIGRYALKV